MASALQQQEAERQIQQMVEFIKAEALEKAEEIKVKTESEFNSKKLKAVAQARLELKEEFERKRKEWESKKRISRSREINRALFEKMKARDDTLKALRLEGLAKLAEVPRNPRYPELIKAFIVQGLMQLMESKVEIRCREVDLKIVKSVADSALKDFRAALKQFAGIEPPVQISINETDFLPPPPSPNYEGQTCPGGVVLSARGGKIICRNTLDARYELAFQQLLPVIREALFGRRAEIAKPNPDAAAAAAHAKH